MHRDDPFVLLISGPAGAGKTTVAAAWAETRRHATAHVPLDEVRCFLRAGFVDPADGWNAECRRQYRFARRACTDLATRYLAEGIACVIDDAVFPDWSEADYGGWRDDLVGLPHEMIVLLPSWEQVAARNRRRTGRRRLPDDMLATIYRMMEPWREQRVFPVIDTTDLSVADTVAAVRDTLARLGRA